MHWSKRLVFFLTLLAFLSNLALANAVNLTKKEKLPSVKHGQKQFNAISNQEPLWLFTEAQEEFEESEFESDHNLDLDLIPPIVPIYLDWELLSSIPKACTTQLNYNAGLVQLWCRSFQKIIIYNQVFRI
jgi:hypothetical protein